MIDNPFMWNDGNGDSLSLWAHMRAIPPTYQVLVGIIVDLHEHTSNVYQTKRRWWKSSEEVCQEARVYSNI